MGKKILAFLCIFIISVCTLTGCKKENEGQVPDENTINLYYLSSNEDMLATEHYSLTSEDTIEQIEEVLDKLIAGPTKVGGIALLPRDLLVNDVVIENEIVKVNFSKEYYINIQNEFLARLSIIQSIGNIDKVNSIELYINGQPIKDSNDKIVGNMNVNNYIVSKGRPDELKRTTNINLYFSNEKGDKLIQETIMADIPFNLPIEYTIVELLIEGPISKGQISAINPKTTINSIKIKNGICYMDLSKEFLTNTLDINEEIIVYSLVNTLVELSNFNKVKIYINGKVEEVYRDKVKISGFLERNLDIVEAK